MAVDDVEGLGSLRERSGLTLREAASAVGIHHETLRRYERDDRPVPQEIDRALRELYLQPGTRERLVRRIAERPGITKRDLFGKRPRRADLRALVDLVASGEVRIEPVDVQGVGGRMYRREGYFWGYVEPQVDREFGWIVTGEELAHTRKRQELKAREVARRLGKPLKTYEHWEANSPPPGWIGRIADALGELPPGNELKGLLHSSGWTLADLAQATGVSTSTAQAWVARTKPLDERYRSEIIVACEAMRSQQGAPYRDLCDRIEKYIARHPESGVGVIVKVFARTSRKRRITRLQVLEAIRLGQATGRYALRDGRWVSGFAEEPGRAARFFWIEPSGR